MNRRDFLSLAVASGLPALPGSARAGTNDPDAVFLRPSDRAYETYRQGFNSRIAQRPAVIAVCHNEPGVRKAVQRARTDGLAVSIKSGGHHFEGYSSNTGGLCIDLTAMNSLRPGGDGRVVAGPGARLIQVYEELMPRGRLLPTGSCAMVGLSGITLGGGYGLFAREHGLTCDWLRRARIVDGHGQVREVVDGSELMWALRGGGGGGLGVVTELEFQTVKSPASIFSQRFKAFQLKPGQVADRTRKWFELAAQLPRHAFSAYVLSGTTLTVLVTSTAPDADHRFRGILSELGKITDKTWPPAVHPVPAGIRPYYGKVNPLPFRNASAGFYRSFADIEPAIASVAGLVGRNPGLLMQINTLGGAIDDPVPENHSAYAHRGFPFLGEIQSYWENPERARPLSAAVDQVQALFRQAGVSRHYANYADGSLEQWAVAYYGQDGYRRLRQVKKQMDPDNIFRHPQSIVPGA